MTWKANASEDFVMGHVVVRLAERRGDDLIVATDAYDGDVMLQTQPASSEVPAFLRLPREAAEALRDALNGHMPPRDDSDLREALQVERDRVDRLLATVRPRWEFDTSDGTYRLVT